MGAGEVDVRRGRGSSRFVGRAHAIERFGAALGEAGAGGPAIVLVSGPAGMGKTRLVDEVLARHRGEVGVVLTGTSQEDGGLLTPLGPVEQVGRQLPGGRGVDDRDVPRDVPRDAEGQVRVVVDAVRDVSRTDPITVVVLEDLHWADTTTLEFVQFAAHALVGERVLLVGTHRDGPDVRPPLRRLITSMGRLPHCTRIDLGPLDRDDVAALVAERHGESVERAVVDTLVSRADGVTLFVEELAVGLRAGGPEALPPAVRDVFVALLDGLGLGARELADWAAVCGQRFRHELVAEVTGLPQATLGKRMDELLDAGVLVVDESGRDYRFRHDLLHDTVRGELRPLARRRLQAACARVLEVRPDLTPGSAHPSVDLARRWSIAGHPRAALRAHLRAVDDASRRGAHDEAARLAAAACQWLQRVPADEREGRRAAEVLALAADTADRAGQYARAARGFERALAAPDVVSSDLARLYVALLRVRYLAGDLVGAAEAARMGVDALTDDAPLSDRAVVMAVTGVFLLSGREPGEVLRRTQGAVDLARRSGDSSALVDALSSLGLALARCGDPDRAREALLEAEHHATGLDDPRSVLRPAVYHLLVLHGVGATRAAADVGMATTRRADELGVSRGIGQQARVILADCLRSLGRWAEAGDVVDEGLAWRETGLAGLLLRLVRVDLAILRGRPRDAERHLQELREEVPDGHFRLSLAEADVAWWRRDVGASRRHAADGIRRAGLLADPDEFGRLVVALVRCGPDASSEPGIPTPVEAAELLAARSAHPVYAAWHATAVATLDEHQHGAASAAAAWDHARAAWTSLDRPPMVALATWRAGLAHLAAGRDEHARGLLRAAEDLADELGAVPVAIEARAARSTLGHREPTPGPAAPGVARGEDPAGRLVVGGERAGVPASDVVGPGAGGGLDLTDREADVLDLVALGWTNKRVGEELDISPRTVSTHVSRILGKLGVATRGEAAAVHHRSLDRAEPT